MITHGKTWTALSFAIIILMTAAATPRFAIGQDAFLQIETERLNKELVNGNYKKALELAETYNKEFQDFVKGMSARERYARNLDILWRRINVRAALATSHKYFGNYDEAKQGLESAIDGFEELRDKLWQRIRAAGAYKGAYEQVFLEMWDRGTIRGMVNAANAANAADDAHNSLQSNLFRVELLHAELLDTLGSLELDQGKLAAAERHFRNGLRVREFLGGEKLKDLGGPHASAYATFTRNFGRLFLKQGDDMCSNGNLDLARQLYDRAESYFAEANAVLAGEPGNGLTELAKADLLFNNAELAMARAVYLSEGVGRQDQAKDQLDKAEQALLEASALVEKQLETHDHPYLVYCWADLAGVYARRTILLNKELPEAATEYITRSKKLLENRGIPNTTGQARLLESEKKWIEAAIAKKK